jgi:hypothetical protein
MRITVRSWVSPHRIACAVEVSQMKNVPRPAVFPFRRVTFVPGLTRLRSF